jgi:tuftelin-interacting protein 11
MTDNIMDQLVMPKVQKAVSDWTRTDPVPLHTFVLPWLPHLGLRLDTLLDDARRRLRSFLRSWTVLEGVPLDLLVWKDVSQNCWMPIILYSHQSIVQVFKAREWNEMLLKYVVPKLGASLRDDFKINPRNQDMEPLLRVAPWVGVLKPAVFSQLLEMEFFPKWLTVLHLWLIQPTSNFSEVAEWYARLEVPLFSV